ncbi:MAG: sugar ABC transporter ATP-binding protein [Anaerolinea sp.]|nr:sugar ABC transporter ATP-binding protein [Anaerolinea sp.]
MASVRLEALAKWYGDVEAVKAIDLVVPDGQFTVLVGPSGCGKTSTLRMIAGLEEASGGRIFIDDRDVTKLPPKDRDTAMVFQNYALYPHMRVRDNIAFGLRARRVPDDEVRRRVVWAADLLDLGGLLDRKPGALSGGQQQRVAIGRAIVREPAVFLFDEPLSNLDAKLRVEMRTELLRIQRQLKATVVYVTHDQEEAMSLSDVMVVMREGRIAQQGPPAEVYARPDSEFVGAFIGSPAMNLLDGTVADGRLVAGVIIADVAPSDRGVVRVGIRPEEIVLASSIEADEPAVTFDATVELIEALGPRVVLSLVPPHGSPMTAVIEARSAAALREGATARMAVRHDALHVFPARHQD